MEEKSMDKKEKVNIFKKIGTKVKGKKDEVSEFLAENPQITISLLSGLGLLLSGGVKVIAGAGSQQKKNCRVQDDVTNEYFMTKHPLTNEEILELGERMIDGEFKGKALNDMGLLR